uniref:Iodothyronine deiodinase n=1 Tax=Lepisosteus oculatus TaxID=7918 RepID=W5MQZ8_LEPOC
MGMLSVDLLVTLQILPGFFSNCLFLALYDSVVLVKRVVSALSCSGSDGEFQRTLTSAGLRSIWNSFLLDAYKQVSTAVRPAPGGGAPARGPTFCASAPVHTEVRLNKLLSLPQVKLGGDAPNSKVVKVPGGGRPDECRLLDFESSDRPLVVNFGSATLPGLASCSFKVRKHRSLEERCQAARRLLEHFSLPPQCQLVADCMDNNTNVAYGVSFERVCIVQQQKIAYLGGKGPFFYNLNEVRQWLEHSYGKR